MGGGIAPCKVCKKPHSAYVNGLCRKCDKKNQRRLEI